MIFLQAAAGTTSGFNYIMLLGTMGMVTLTLGIVFFVIFHQRKVTRFNLELKKLEDEKQQIWQDGTTRVPCPRQMSI